MPKLPTQPSGKHSSSEAKKILWYDLKDVLENSTCPSCGRPMEKFKLPVAHVKRCFSIKKIGPVYRLHGYKECECGLLIADNKKAEKLHICSGAVPIFAPDINCLRSQPGPFLKINNESLESHVNPAHNIKCKERKNKPWIRNFVTPINVTNENINHFRKAKPRVRNFEMPLASKQPQDVWIYSISHANYRNSMDVYSECTLPQAEETVFLLKKRAMLLPNTRLKYINYLKRK